MNRYVFFGLLLLLSGAVTAQNYYVTVLKGKVTYQGKVLKKRDKIQIKGALRFSSQDDWVKVAGPGGIYKLTPEDRAANGSEFFTALREELFPKVRVRGSYAYGMTYNDRETDCFFLGPMVNYFHGQTFTLPEALEGFEQDLRFIFTTGERVATLPVPVKGGAIVLHEKYWRTVNAHSFLPPERSSKGIITNAACIVVLNDPDRFAAARDTARNFSELGLDLTSCSGLEPVEIAYTDAAQRRADSLRISNYAYPSLGEHDATATLLDCFYPGAMLDRKAFDRDMRFLIRKTKPQNAEDFLDTMQFDDYIKDTYGQPDLPVRLSVYLDTLIDKYVR